VSTEEHRLRVFENRMLRGIFGLKRDEVTVGVSYSARNLIIHILFKIFL
jgi:hypothetical protein